MRWLVCFVLLTGCLRARATMIHPTELGRVSGTGSHASITRTAPSSEQPPAPQSVDESTRIGSLELGALIAFGGTHDSARVHIAPGVRIFRNDVTSVLGGVAVGVDFPRGFAFEGSLHAGGGGNDPNTVQVAADVFAGFTLHSSSTSTSIAVGPSVGLLGLPGGHSVVMLGLGLRLTSGRSY
jgi:hypothetical protein